MFRPLLIAGFAAASLAPVGCVGTWDTITSQRMREHPFQTTKRLIVPEDPVPVLLADPPRTGDDRAAAMRRLKASHLDREGPETREAVLTVLERAATADSSPVLRMEAIGALGRLDDPRAAGILMVAYRNAHGRGESEPAPPPPPADPGVVPAGGRRTVVRELDRFPLTGPTGYPPEWVSAIRCRAAESLGRTSTPEAAKFLATIAGGAKKDTQMEGSEDRDVRLAAVRGLGKCRNPEAVTALAEVLQVEATQKDTAVIGRTHEGLVRLTGNRLPPDPAAWNEVVQAGVVIAPEPSWVENAVETAMFWTK